MKEDEIMAYVAGLMDGDGSFSIIKEKPQKEKWNPLYYPCIQLANASEKLIDFLLETFDGRKLVRNPYVAKDGGHRRINFNWMIKNNPRCKVFISKIINYLVVKKQQAFDILEYINHLESLSKIESKSNDTLLYKERIHLSIMYQNQLREYDQFVTRKLARHDSIEGKFWCYVAGLIDSDGSFTITRRNQHTHMVSPFYSPLIQIASINVKSLNYILENFTGGKVRVREAINAQTGFCYKYILTNYDHIFNFCKNIHAYLIVKKDQCEIMMNFCKNKKDIKKCKDRIPQEEIDFREECRSKIMQLNMGSLNLT